MREVLVLVENLTDSDFQLSGRFVEEGSPQVSLPPMIQRAARLRWRLPDDGGAIAVAAEYSSASGEEAGSGSDRVLVVAALLPAEKDWAANAVGWITGSSSTKAHFTAALCERPRNGKQTNLAKALADATPVTGHVNRRGVEWMPARVTADELEIRLRLLPSSPRQQIAPEPSETAARASTGEVQAADETEIQRLEGYRKIVRALNKQSALMELQADSEAMNLSRLRDLPEKARVDLLLLILGALLSRRQQALAAWGASEDNGDEQPTAKRESHTTGHNFMKVLSSTVRDTMPGMFAHAEQAKEEENFSSVLADHADRVHRALAPLLGFDQGEKRLKVANLIDAYLRCEPGCQPDLPDVAALCVAVRAAVDEAGGGGASASDDAVGPPLPRFSAERSWRLGSEHAAARFLKRASILDMDLCATTELAAERLNLENRTCPEDCCIAYLAHCSCYGALYREGRREEALAQLGMKSEEELASCEEVQAKLERLEDFIEPGPGHEGRVTEEGASRRPPAIPRLWLAARDLLAMLLGAGDGAYDARSRSAFLEIFVRLGVPPRLAVRWEAEIGGALFEALETSNIVAAQNESQKGWNRGKVALAAAGGGLLLAVTGGLAAPAVAAGVSAIGATAVSAGAALGLAQAGAVVGATVAGWGAALASLGTAGAAVVFGATGAGITGWKLSRRWGDLTEFHFQPLARSTRWVHTSVEISDPATIQRLDNLLKQGGKLHEDLVVENRLGTPVALPRSTSLVRSGFLPNASLGSPRKASAAEGGGDEAARRPRGTTGSMPLTSLGQAQSGRVVRYDFQREVDRIQRAVHLAIFVSGWVQAEQDFTQPWSDAARLFFPSSGHLALRWESKQLLELGSIFGQMVAQEVASSTASFWLKSSAVTAAGAAGSLAAMTVAWPVWIISAMANLDNSWLVCIERARVAGKCLAHALADRHTVGQRPVTLVGHSIGARLLVYCLLELYRMGEFHVVDDVVLLGTPVTTGESKWQKVRAVVSGRVVNGYLGSDWVLAFLYRYLEWGLSVAGLSEVNVPGVENVNLSGLGIAGHHDYPRHVLDILARMRIGERGVPTG